MSELLFGIIGFGITWMLTEAVAFLAGLIVVLRCLYRRVFDLKRTAVWLISFYALPIITCILWIMVGRPVYRHPPESPRAGDADAIDSLIGARPEDEGLHLARSLSVGGAMGYSEDSSCTLIDEGDGYIDGLLKDLGDARESIYMEIYQISRDDTSMKVMDALCAKAREGLDVRVIFDDFGYDAKDKCHLKSLEKAGGRAVLFHNMTKYLFSPKKNARDHRKTAVIDGRIGYQGGFNIEDRYTGRGKLGRWRDAAVRIEGPQAGNLARLFACTWEYVTKEPMTVSVNEEPCGNTPMQVVPGDPTEYPDNPAENMFVALARQARSRLWIETPYFIPSEPMLKAVQSAAAAGVDVRIIIPSVPDHPAVYWANRRYADRAMGSGAKVYEFQDGFMHSKTVLVDDSVCCIGCTNFSNRSVKLNFECSIVAYSEELAAGLESDFLEDQGLSSEYTRGMYSSRTGTEKFRTALAMLFNEQL